MTDLPNLTLIEHPLVRFACIVAAPEGVRQMEEHHPGVPVSGPADRPRPAVLVLLLAAALTGVPAEAVGQEAGPADDTAAAVSVDSAAALRASLERPPSEPPFDAMDAVALPFRIAVLPLNLAGEGIAFLLNEFTAPKPPNVLVRAYRDVAAWGLIPALTTDIGSRSSPGFRLRLTRFAPLTVESGYSLRQSRVHRATVVLGGSRARVSLGGEYVRDAAPKFWGIGPGTALRDESVYSRDRVLASVTGRYRVNGSLVLDGGAGFERNEVDRALGDDLPDIQDTFGEGAFFGIAGTTRFWRATATATLDLTRQLRFQRRGFFFEAGVAGFLGAGGTDADFHRFTGEARGYLPLNRRQQLALRGMVETNRRDAGGGVPFYHLASLGDQRAGRGFDENRFRDRDMAGVTAEWRYEIWRELQGRMRVESFLFVDHGAVTSSFSELDGSDFRTSYGYGWRVLPAGTGVRAWWHLAFSDEDTRVRAGFGTVF